MHRQFVPAGPAAGLETAHRSGAWLAAGHQGGSGPVLGRVALVAVAVLVVGAFTVLEIMARSRRARPAPGRHLRWLDASGWSTSPPGYSADARRAEAPPGGEDGYRRGRWHGDPPRGRPGRPS